MGLSDQNGGKARIVEEIGLSTTGLSSLRTPGGVIRVEIRFDIKSN